MSHHYTNNHNSDTSSTFPSDWLSDAGPDLGGTLHRPDQPFVVRRPLLGAGMKIGSDDPVLSQAVGTESRSHVPFTMGTGAYSSDMLSDDAPSLDWHSIQTQDNLSPYFADTIENAFTSGGSYEDDHQVHADSHQMAEMKRSSIQSSIARSFAESESLLRAKVQKPLGRSPGRGMRVIMSSDRARSNSTESSQVGKRTRNIVAAREYRRRTKIRTANLESQLKERTQQLDKMQRAFDDLSEQYSSSIQAYDEVRLELQDHEGEIDRLKSTIYYLASEGSADSADHETESGSGSGFEYSIGRVAEMDNQSMKQTTRDTTPTTSVSTPRLASRR